MFFHFYKIVYADNDNPDKAAFDAKLEFDTTLIPYSGDDRWISKTLQGAKKCLDSDKVPKANKDCDYCAYREAVDSAV